jgi:hypothetical protein
VPSRIVYQGRLSKSGVGAAGRHTITVQFVDASGTNLSQSQTFDVDVPTSGDFSLEIDHIPPDADWINGLPKMRVIVGGETLTPDQSFSAAPYALVARNVENLDTSKVKLAGQGHRRDRPLCCPRQYLSVKNPRDRAGVDIYRHPNHPTPCECSASHDQEQSEC